MSGDVRTFEVVGGEVREGHASADLGAASGALPAGAYTTLRTYPGRRVLRLSQHIRRLVESAALQAVPGSLDEDAVARALAAALDAAGFEEARLRLTFAPPRLFVSVEPFHALDPAAYRDGVACVTMPLLRTNPRSKDTRFIATAAEAYRSLPAGANEGLMVAEDGSVLEGLSSNFFAVSAGTLRTARDGVLHGVTRSQILELAATLLPVYESPIDVAELPFVTESFITSVSRGVLPVVRIDGREVGSGRPGPVTEELGRLFDDLVEREAVALPSAR